MRKKGIDVVLCTEINPRRFRGMHLEDEEKAAHNQNNPCYIHIVSIDSGRGVFLHPHFRQAIFRSLCWTCLISGTGRWDHNPDFALSVVSGIAEYQKKPGARESACFRSFLNCFKKGDFKRHKTNNQKPVKCI